MTLIKTLRDLEVFQISYDLALEIFELSRSFPKEEIYSLTNQIRRSSRSVSANLAEAYRKRRYEKAFIAKLSDSEAEAAETQVWLDFAKDYGYMTAETHHRLFKRYNDVIGKIVMMIYKSKNWTF